MEALHDDVVDTDLEERGEDETRHDKGHPRRPQPHLGHLVEDECGQHGERTMGEVEDPRCRIGEDESRCSEGEEYPHGDATD